MNTEDSYQVPSTIIVGVIYTKWKYQKEQKREKRIKEMFEEMMTANFLKLNSDTNLQIHGT